MSPRKQVLGIGAPRLATAEFASLQEIADVHWFTPVDHAQCIAEVARLCAEKGPFDAAYVLFGTAKYSPFTETMLAPLFPGCGLFASGGAGYDDIPTAWLASKGAYAANTPTAAEMNVRAGKWRDGLELTDDPMGKTFIGIGKIGQATARKIQALGMDVIYNSRTRLPEADEKTLNLTYVSEDELLARSDVLSLHCPLTPDTRGWLNADRIAKMKDGAYIVNTSRGDIIDEPALKAALESRKLAHAALDVFVGEPNPDPWFTSSPYVTVQPHFGAFTKGTIHTGERQVLDNVRTFLETGKPRYPVNEPVRT